MDRIKNEYIRGTVQVGVFGGESPVGVIALVWTWAKMICWVCDEKDAEDRAARREEKRKV